MVKQGWKLMNGRSKVLTYSRIEDAWKRASRMNRRGGKYTIERA